MGKRFFDTELCEKEWYAALLPIERCFIRDVLFSKCDSVGVWCPNDRQVKYLVGELNYKTIPEKSNGNIEILPNGKWWIIDFCDFQYGQLSQSCKPHASYIALLNKHGLLERVGAILCKNGDISYTAKRGRISGAKKNKIFARDDYTCQYCGVKFEYDELQIDHVYPLSNGGSGEDWNLATACKCCNAAKGISDPEIFIESKGIKPLISVIKAIRRAKEMEEEGEKEKDISYINLNSNIISKSENKPEIDKCREVWNNHSVLPNYKYSTLNMGETVRAQCLRPWAVYSTEEIIQAIDNYAKILQDINYDPQAVYSSFPGFMGRGVEIYADSAKPFELVRKKRQAGGDQTDDARKRALDELAKLRGK